MLRKQYHLDREFSLLLQLSGEMDEQMAQIDRLLCDDKLFALIAADLSKGYPLSTQTGRKSTPVEVIKRDAGTQTFTRPELRTDPEKC